MPAAMPPTVSKGVPTPVVDVALNVFAKPYQTALSLLSLLRFSREHIGVVFLQFEPFGSEFDTGLPYAVAHYLEDRPDLPDPVVSQPKYWLKLDPTDPARLADPAYRLSIRYQHAFEESRASHLLILHNDVLILRDFAGALLQSIGDAFVVGELGQCWNCPAKSVDLVRAAGLGDEPCQREQYQDFRPDFPGLVRLYDEAVKSGMRARPYWEGWKAAYDPLPWPLPECRVNEWGCLVNLEMTRPLVAPEGDILPFGSFEACGTIALDTAVAWFRGLNRAGLAARHMDIRPYLRHWVGNGKMTRQKYLRAEQNARTILEKQFPDFVTWCRTKKNGLFL